jgi:hypothetical protein
LPLCAIAIALSLARICHGGEPTGADSAQWWLRRAAAEVPKVESPGQRVYLWQGILDYAARLGDNQLLDEVIEAARKDFVRRNDAAAFLPLLARAQMGAGRLEEAMRTVDQSPAGLTKRELCSEVAVQYAKRADFTMAGRVAAALPEVWQAGAYAAVAAAIAAKDPKSVVEFVQAVPLERRTLLDPKQAKSARV